MRFGAGRIDELADACRSLKIVRPLIITDKFICKLPFTQKAAMILAAADLASSVFDDVQTNPNEAHLKKAIGVFQEGKHDGVIALGGGSVIDLAKLVAFMSLQVRPIWDFQDIGNQWMLADPNKIFPIVAIPTTAGTGSEVGRAGVLINSETNTKNIILYIF